MRRLTLSLCFATLVASQAFLMAPDVRASSSGAAAYMPSLFQSAVVAQAPQRAYLSEALPNDPAIQEKPPGLPLLNDADYGLRNLPSEIVDASLRLEVESNNSSAEAESIDPLNAPVRVRGSIQPSLDTDWFAIQALAGDRIYAATATSNSGGGTDTFLALMASDGATVIEEDDNDGGFSTSASVIANVNIPADGTYYIRVRSGAAASAQVAPYDLIVDQRRGAPVADTEPNENALGGQALPASGWVSGYIANSVAAGENDYFTGISAQAGDTIVAILDLDPNRAGGTRANGRLGIGLFGSPTPTQILVVDRPIGGAPAPPAEAMFMTVKNSGLHTVYVDSTVATGTGTTGTTGNYTLSVYRIPAQPASPSCTTYTSGVIDAALTDAGQSEFTLNVPDNVRIGDLDVAVRLNHPWMTDLDAQLISPQGTPALLFTGIGANGPSGTQPQMDVVLNDEAIMSLTNNFTAINNQQRIPEAARRLSSFDGQDSAGTWTLRLFDKFADDAGVLNEWSVTVCEAPPPPVCAVGFQEVEVYATDFEADNGGFTAEGDWVRGLPAKPALNRCNDGSSSCFVTALTGLYTLSATQNLVSPAIDLTDYVGPVTLHWAHAHQVENFQFDQITAVAREPGGGNPHLFFRNNNPTRGTTASNYGSPAAIIPEHDGWGVFQEDLSDFAGGPVEVAFNLTSDSSVPREGWAIDDVRVTACEAIPVADPEIQVSPTSLSASIQQGASQAAPVSISNIGEGTLNWTVDVAPTSCAAPGAVSWLSAAPTSGATIPGSPDSTTVTMNAAALAPGAYSAFVCVNSNAANSPQVSIPVDITVTAGPQPAFYNGALTTSSSTYDNPDGSSTGSGIHYYCAQEFTVDASGTYVIESASPNTSGTPSDALDTFLALYANAFNPGAPAGPQAFNDDFTGTLTVLPGPYAGTVTATATGFQGAQPASRLPTANLTAGTNYFLVQTSFRETNYVTTGTQGQPVGAFYTGISGPGGVTLVGNGCAATGGGDPEITVAPAALDFTVAANGTDSDDLSITNSGGGTLTWEIETAAVASMALRAELAPRTLLPRGTGSFTRSGLDAGQVGSPIPARGGNVAMSQTTSTTPIALNSVSCNAAGSHADNSYFRRYYFDEHPGLGTSATINSVDVSVEEAAGSANTLIVNLYTVPSSAPVDTIPTGSLTQIGTATVTVPPTTLGSINVPVTASVSDTVANDLVVEVFTPNGQATGESFFIGSTNTGETHPSFLQAADCGITTPTPTAAIGFANMQFIMVVNAVDGGGPGPVGCDNPSTIPWLDVGTASGSAAAGETDLSTISVDATGLAAGDYDALLCVTSNDTAGNELVEVPVSLTVSGGGGGDVEYSVDPTSLTASQAAGTTTQQTLTLTNNGTQTGTYSIVESAANGRPGKPALLGGPTELYSNGPFITNPGAGAGGADASVLESTILSTYGYGAQQSAGNRAADEFVVPASGWTVDEMTFYTYQTGSTTTSTITGITVQIWDGVPGEAGSNVVFGDTTTNVMASTTWSNVYRSIDTAITDSTRPIMEVVADIGGLSLAGGTYWVDFQFNGTLGSGPWAPPITILGQAATGNGLQSLAGAPWTPAIDTLSGAQAGFPFVITGTGEGGGGTCQPSDAPWLSVSPTSGSTPAGGSSPVTVSFNSTGLTAGVYNATLCVLSNDSVGNEEIEVPVSLTVTGGGGPFPAPYCSLVVTNDIEPITRVILGSINNTSSPVVDGSPALEDFLSVQTSLTAGATVEMRVESNTAGDFTHHIRTYFDWNNDGDFTDAGEFSDIGTIDNSTGVDGQQAIGNVVVPATANGPVRMRVTAQFNAPLANPCGPISWGQAEDYTVNVTGGGGGDPVIDVAPEALSLAADVGASDSDDLSISNIGQGVLTWSIDTAEPVAGSALAPRSVGTAKGEFTLGGSSGIGAGLQGSPITPNGDVAMSQTTSTAPVALNSVSCNAAGSHADNSYFRRYYFDEHAGLGASATINSVDVSVEEAAGSANTLVVNVYTIPSGTPVDTIPLGSLTLIGTASTTVPPTTLGSINVPVSASVADTAASDLVVEVFTPNGQATGETFFIGSTNTGETHASFIMAADCGIATPTPTSAIGFANMQIILVVNASDGGGGPGPVGCDNPATIPWLSASPDSGSAAAGETDLSTITANATGLTPGTYDALLCVNSNDAVNPIVEVPVEFEVTAGVDDGIFCDGFEGGDGSCDGGGPGDPDIVIIEDVNFVPNPDFTGGSIQWADGTTCNCDTAPFNFNVYDAAGSLAFFWPLNATSPAEGGVSLDGGTTYAVLGSGATIGPSSTFLLAASSAAAAPFATAGTGYIGFQFDNGGTVNYGYAEVTRGAGGRPFTIVSIAYNSAGDPITIP
jgi:subtilisin-like proprotein convertase family protein